MSRGVRFGLTLHSDASSREDVAGFWTIMSRFHKLEFEGVRRRDNGAQEQGAVPDSIACLTQAREAFDAGRFEAALRAYSKVLEFDSNCTEAWLGQARMLIEMNEPTEAGRWTDKALELFESDHPLLAAKAVTLGRLGEFEAARSFSDASVEGNGESPYIWLARGDVFLAANEPRAEYCFLKLSSLAGGDWRHAWLAARSHCAHGRHAAGLKFARQAQELDATRAVAWTQAGLCEQALGLTRPAMNSFGRALELDPGCLVARKGLNSLHHTRGWARLAARIRGLMQR